MKKLDKLLKSSENRDLERLVKRAENMDSLTSVLRAELTAEMAENLVAANVREDGVLILVCASSAWAARLRFETEQLLGTARRFADADISHCVVRVAR